MSEKVLKSILVILAIGVFGFFFYSTLGDKWLLIYDKYFPCRRPVVYSLGTFDQRFGLSEKDFLQALAQAEEIWEKPVGKNLFTYQANAEDSVKVNLIYDYRQDATTKLHTLGIAVSNTRASYDELKSKYDALVKTYTSAKSKYEADVASFNQKQAEYESEVKNWNSKGGAPKDVYNSLNQQADSLHTEAASLKEEENNLNDKAAEINSLITVLNQLADSLNLKVSTLNTIGRSRGEEFTEGEYKSDASGREIDIYEFSTKNKLERVLAHEMGHALGLDHVDDPKAIMYKLNSGISLSPTEADLDALKTYCGIK